MTQKDFQELVKHLVDSDRCPACTQVWVICRGRCVLHVDPIHPAHFKYNDDCRKCVCIGLCKGCCE